MFKPGDRVKVSGHGEDWTNATIEGIVKGGQYSGEYYIINPNGKKGIIEARYITAIESDAPKSLRDEFAMAALNSIYQDNNAFEYMARDAYALADAMMKERAK